MSGETTVSGIARGGARAGRRRFACALLTVAASIGCVGAARAACGGVATAYCVSAFSTAETPPGVGAIPSAGFSFQGPGAFSLTLSDPISGKTGVDVRVTDGSQASVTTGGLVTGTAGDGVSVSSATGPAQVTIGAGGVTATAAGVRASSSGGGNITIDGAGAITAGGGPGVTATSVGGNVFVNEAGAIAGTTGVSASTSGAGGLTILTIGAIKGTAGDGVVSQTGDGLNALVVGAGGVSGSANGLNISATGAGNLSLFVAGSATGGTGSGLVATTHSGASSITIDSAATLGGGTSGLSVASDSGSATIVNNGAITGAGGVAFVSSMGSGAASLQNNGAISGAAANVGGGLAIVNNATLDGAVTTAAGATTSVINIGAWTRAGGSTISAFTNAGSLSLGPTGGAPATLAVSGDASFASTSSWSPRLTATGSDRIAVGGTTTIGGGTLAIAITPGIYRVGSAYDLVTSTGGVTGAFDHAYVTGGYFSSTFATTATGLSLTLGYGDLRPLAVTRNESAVAQALYTGTRIAPTGAAETLLSSIYSQSGTAPLAALAQMNADAPGAAINANLNTGRMFTETLSDRQESWRAGDGIDPGAPGGWYTGAPRQKATLANQRGFGVWSTGFGGIGSFAADKTLGASAQSQNAAGAALGVDYRFGPAIVGVAGGVSEGAFQAGAATGTARGVHVGVYSGMTIGNFYTAASLTGASYSDDTSRLVTGPAGLAGETETGRFSAQEARAHIEAGWRDPSPGLHIAPFAAVETAVLQTNRYAETLGKTGGAGLLGLAYASQTTPSTPGFLGLRLEGQLVLPDGVVLTPTASLAWEYEFAAQRTVNAALVVLPDASFTVAGVQPSANALQVKLGVQAHLSKTVALFAAFDGEFSSNYHGYAGRGGVTVDW